MEEVLTKEDIAFLNKALVLRTSNKTDLEEYMKIEGKIMAALKENSKLKQENEELRKKLSEKQ